MPKVSVIVPAYNTEKYISQTFDSILNQTLQDTEIIVVNDGSTDGTQAIIDDYCSRHEKIKKIYQENSGVSAARNVGLSIAKGDYVLFLDSDDVITEITLEAYYNALTKYDADVAVGRVMMFGSITERYNEYADKIAKKEIIEVFDKDMLWSLLVSNKCYNRQRLVSSRVLFKPLKYAEDALFFVEYLMGSRPKIVGVWDACLCYRRRETEQSATQSISFSLVENFIMSSKFVYDIIKEAVKTALPESEAEDYLQEIIYKTDFTLITQFYRLLWSADNATLSYLEREHNRLYAVMNDKSKIKMDEFNSDVKVPIFDKEAIAENPMISVVMGRCGGRNLESTINSVFKQTMPSFELIIPASVMKKFMPEQWRGCENIHVLNDKYFKLSAKQVIKSCRLIYIKWPMQIDDRMFRFLLRVNVPEFLRKRFFNLLFHAARIALKLIK